ncbi:MAG: NAD-binding protein, partial [Gemmataceae bacterium]
QLSELVVPPTSGLIGRRVADLAGQHRLLVVGCSDSHGKTDLWPTLGGERRLNAGDRLWLAGAPADMQPILDDATGPTFAGVRWAGLLRRQLRTLAKTVLAIDRPVLIASSVLLAIILFSAVLFHFGVGLKWADSFYYTVGIVATGGELHGEAFPPWAKLYVSGLKLSGAAIVAVFTAIFTQYLIRARLGGALEIRRIPEEGHIVLCGLGNVGFRCVAELQQLGVPIVAIDKVHDNPFVATVRRMGVPVIIGDSTVPEVLRQARAGTARAVLAVTDSELVNLEVALLVREMQSQSRVILRLNDPLFAEAVRDAAAIRYAVSVPALAAPAFAAALWGDRVQTLLNAAGRTLAVVELVVQLNDPCLHERSLTAAMIDYGFLPVGLQGELPFAASGLPRARRLVAGDVLTVIAELSTLEQLARRQAAPADVCLWVDSFP